MQIKIKFTNENKIHGILPDISYEKFIESYESDDVSDVAYDNYLRENNMIDLTDFNGETTPEIELIVENEYRGRVLKFKCIYDSNNDESFNERMYFVGKAGKFDIEKEIVKLLYSFDFKYIYTMSNDHYFKKEGWKIKFDPEQEEFYVLKIDGDIDDLQKVNRDNLNIIKMLEGDDLTVENVEKVLKSISVENN